MGTTFTLGIEQEFQLVDPQSGELHPGIQSILEKGRALLGEHIKPEAKQCCVELVTGVCPTIDVADQELTRLNRQLKQIVREEQLGLIAAGTHPGSAWQNQKTTPGEHYQLLEEEFQELERMLVIYGLHIHVGVESRERMISLFNQVRSWLPHLLALSTNSPFWSGRYTGLKSFRSALWKSIPHTGMPPVFSSWEDFQSYIHDLVATGCITSAKDFCWDVRPHLAFQTLEFRICDMPTTKQGVLALTALCQALIMKLSWMDQHQRSFSPLPRDYIEENKWAAMRYGMEGEIRDFHHHRRIPLKDAIWELLEFVDDVVDDLGSRREIHYLRSLLESPYPTGADRQIAVYEQTGDVHQVTQFLLQQTMEML